MCCFFLSRAAPSGIFPLSLHDALPIWLAVFEADRGHGLRALQLLAANDLAGAGVALEPVHGPAHGLLHLLDRKSTRLNSSHVRISYAVFCLKKKSTQALRNGRSCCCRN